MKISNFFFDIRFEKIETVKEIAGKKYGMCPNPPLSVMNISSEINLIYMRLKAGKGGIGDAI